MQLRISVPAKKKEGPAVDLVKQVVKELGGDADAMKVTSMYVYMEVETDLEEAWGKGELPAKIAALPKELRRQFMVTY